MVLVESCGSRSGSVVTVLLQFQITHGDSCSHFGRGRKLGSFDSDTAVLWDVGQEGDSGPQRNGRRPVMRLPPRLYLVAFWAALLILPTEFL